MRKSLEAGARPAFPPSVVVDVKRLACELPSRSAVPLARFTIPDLQREVLARGIVAQISGVTLWRWLSADALQPWRHRSWIFPRDPQFAEKAGRVLDLYARTWDGTALRPDEFVVSADSVLGLQTENRVSSDTARVEDRIEARVTRDVKVGDRVVVLPSGARSTVTSIVTRDGKIDEAFARQSVTLELANDIDISRGDIIASEERPPVARTDFKATLCWMNERKLRLNHRYVLRHTTKSVRAIINEIDYRLNVNTLEREAPVSELQTNDIGQVRIKTLQPIVCDPYTVNRQLGGFILVDENNDTVAAGMIQE